MKIRSALENVVAYPVKGRDRRDCIRLDLNESTRGCSPKVLEALRNLGWKDVGAYPQYHQLGEKTATILGIGQHQLLFTNGADDGIRSIFQAYLDPGDEIVLAEPTFGIIPIHAKIMGATLKSVPYGADFRFPFMGFRQAISPKTKLIAIVRPDSPTGGVISAAQLRELLQLAPHALVMLDETYHHFLGESLVRWIAEFSNLVVLHSFSKAYCLAGMRCGLIAANTAIINEIRKVDPPFSLSSPGVIAISAALEDPQHIENVVADVKLEKTWLVGQFRERGRQVHDTRANFILVNFGEDAGKICEQLAAQKILIKDLSGIPLLKGWCRVAIGTRQEHLALLDNLDGIT